MGWVGKKTEQVIFSLKISGIFHLEIAVVSEATKFQGQSTHCGF